MDETARKEFENLLSSFSSSQNQKNRISPKEWKLLSPWILDDIQRGESIKCIEEELHLLESYASIIQLVDMVTSKEGVSVIRKSIFHMDDFLRLLYVSVLGRVVVRVYIALNNGEVDLEGIIHVDSSREAVRVREDFNDLAMDVIKGVSLGAIGKAVGVDPATKNEIAFEDDARANEAYCDVLASLLDYYFYSFSELDGWCFALLGLPAGSVRSSSILNCSAEKAYSRSVCLLPLVKLAISTTFADPYLLVRRSTTQFFTQWNSNARLVSNFLKCILVEISSTGTPLTTMQLVDKDRPGRLFAEQSMSEDVLTEESRSGYNPLVIVDFAQEWVCHYLMYVVNQTIDVEELTLTVKDIITITQHRVMTYCRQQVCKAILQKLLEFLEAGSGSSSVADRMEVLCWIVLLLRDVWPSMSVVPDEAASIESALSIVSNLFIRTLQALLSLDSDVAMTRLLADFALTLVFASVESFPQVRCVQDQKLATSNQDATRVSSDKRRHSSWLTIIHMVLNDPIIQSRTQSKEKEHLPGSRFIAALCYACSNSAEITLTCLSRLIELASSLQPKISSIVDDSTVDLLSIDALPVIQSDASRFDPPDLLTSTTTDTPVIRESSTEAQNSFFPISLMSIRNHTSAVRDVVNDVTRECSPWSIFQERSFYRRHNIYYLLLSEKGPLASAVVQSITRSIAEKELKAFVGYLNLIQEISVEVMKTASCCMTCAVVGNVGDVSQVVLVDLAMVVWSSFAPVSDQAEEGSGQGATPSSSLMGPDLWRVLQLSGVTDSVLHDRVKATFSEYSSLIVDTVSLIAASSAVFSSRSSAQVKMLAFFTHCAPLLNCVREDAVTNTLEKLRVLIQSNIASSRWQSSESFGKELLESLPTNGMLGGFGLGSQKEDDQNAASIDILCFNLLTNLAQAFASVSRDRLQTVNYIIRCAAAVRDVEEVFMTPQSSTTSTPLISLVYKGIRHTIQELESTYQQVLSDHSDPNTKLPKFPAAKYDIHDSIVAHRKTHESCEKRFVFTNMCNSTVLDLHLMGSPTSSSVQIPFSKAIAKFQRGLPSQSLTQFSEKNFELTDFSIVGSVFVRPESSHWRDSKYAASEDVRSLIVDVVFPRAGLDVDHSHDTKSLHSTAGRSDDEAQRQEESLIDSALTYLSPSDRFWQQVSGSSDLITVLLSTEVNPFTRKVAVYAKAFNSSGFKIPIFRMELVTSSSYNTACFDLDSIQSLDGVEYFLPDSYVYRVFDFTLLDFGAVDVTLQVVYSDLTHSYNNIFPSPRVDASSESKSLSNPTRSQDSVATWTAVVACRPVRLSVSAQLLPYGLGSLSSMRYLYRKNRYSLWYRDLDGLYPNSSDNSNSPSSLPWPRKMAHWARESSRPAIPGSVFYTLWQRLAGDFSKTFTCDCRINWTSRAMQKVANQIRIPAWGALVSEYITEEVSHAINLYGGNGTHLIGMDCRVDFDSAISSSSGSDYSAARVGWCFQTIFGDELVVKMVVIDATIIDHEGENSNPKSSWRGDGREVEVVAHCQFNLRAALEGILEAVEEDVDEFLYGLSAGCCTVATAKESLRTN